MTTCRPTTESPSATPHPAGPTSSTTSEKTGATDTELVDAGLAKWSRRGTLIDLMRDRVVFGIRDHDGDLVGFTGRAAPGDPDAPKWLNTPTTAIFTKGELLFGLAENRDRLAAGATPVRVEGVMDALAITMASDGRAVGLAPLGTALTAAQADALAHAAPQQLVLHATDTDRAGLNAAAKDYWLLTARGADVRRLILTDGQQTFNDPADAYSANPAGLAAALSATAVAPPLAGHLIADLISTNADVLRTGHVHAVVGVARKLGPIIAAAPPDQRADLITAAASMLADATNEDPDHYLELRHDHDGRGRSVLDPAASTDASGPPPRHRRHSGSSSPAHHSRARGRSRWRTSRSAAAPRTTAASRILNTRSRRKRTAARTGSSLES